MAFSTLINHYTFSINATYSSQSVTWLLFKFSALKYRMLRNFKMLYYINICWSIFFINKRFLKNIIHTVIIFIIIILLLKMSNITFRSQYLCISFKFYLFYHWKHFFLIRWVKELVLLVFAYNLWIILIILLNYRFFGIAWSSIIIDFLFFLGFNSWIHQFTLTSIKQAPCCETVIYLSICFTLTTGFARILHENRPTIEITRW